jgi:hypothetical protein
MPVLSTIATESTQACLNEACNHIKKIHDCVLLTVIVCR